MLRDTGSDRRERLVESVSFVGIDIKVIAWDEQSECAVAEDWLEVPPAVEAHNVEDYVVGRFGEPVDVAHAVLYLASGRAGYVTGQTLHVNGGMYME